MATSRRKYFRKQGWQDKKKNCKNRVAGVGCVEFQLRQVFVARGERPRFEAI